MESSGIGKIYIAVGLVYEAVKNGQKVYMMTMGELVIIFQMKELSPSAMTAYNKLLKGNLVAIDDIMFFPVKNKMQ